MTWSINNSIHSTYSQEQGEAFSLTSYLATIQSERVKLNNIQEMSSPQDNEMVSSQTSQSGTTFAPSTENPGEEQLTFSLEDFPAKTSVQPEQTTTSTGQLKDWTESVLDSGVRWLDSLMKYSPVSFSWKTPVTSELKACTSSCKTLTSWGITQGGVNLGVSMSAQTTTVNDNGYLPTPTCHNAKEGAYPAEYTRKTPTLAAQIGGKVNPLWNEWRMGWPIGWTDLKPLETDRIREWRHSHLTSSHEA